MHHDPLLPPGTSTGGVREYNQRVVLHALRTHGALPALEIARHTRLSTQAVSLIVQRLLADGLLLRGDPVRGKVGPPTVPLALAPDGAFFLGVHVGRRGTQVMLADFLGTPRLQWSRPHRHPEPQAVLAEVRRRAAQARRWLGPQRQRRLQGVGIAAPLTLGGWHTLLGVPQRVAAQWERFDLEAAVCEACRLPAMLAKDTIAACLAESVSAPPPRPRNALYIFVGTLVGGGLMLDGRVRAGPHGNAGAVGSMPLGVTGRTLPPQLLDVASLRALEQRWSAAGLDAGAAADARALSAPWLPHTRRWLLAAGRALAMCIASAAALLDLEAVVLDGSAHPALLDALQQATERALGAYPLQGLRPPPLHRGTAGAQAPLHGAALLPLIDRFMPDSAQLLNPAQARPAACRAAGDTAGRAGDGPRADAADPGRTGPPGATPHRTRRAREQPARLNAQGARRR